MTQVHVCFKKAIKFITTTVDFLFLIPQMCLGLMRPGCLFLWSCNYHKFSLVSNQFSSSIATLSSSTLVVMLPRSQSSFLWLVVRLSNCVQKQFRLRPLALGLLATENVSPSWNSWFYNLAQLNFCLNTPALLYFITWTATEEKKTSACFIFFPVKQ